MISTWLHTQLADPGKFVQVGISARARSKPSINWVKNIISKCLSNDFVDNLDWKTTHAFSLLWMLICRRLLDELLDDLVTWLAETGIYWMNKEAVCGLWEQNDEGEIELDINGNSFNFQWAECYNFRRLRQSSTVVVSKVRSQMSLEECKSWTCIVLLGLRAKVQVKGLSIKD